jgi:hypothetical protein
VEHPSRLHSEASPVESAAGYRFQLVLFATILFNLSLHQNTALPSPVVSLYSENISGFSTI